jgi:diguanylate cyclase (GGDEF)-like protein
VSDRDDHPLEDPTTDVTRLSSLPEAARALRWTLQIVSGADAGRLVPLEKARTLIGRGSGGDVQLDHMSLSRRHALLVIEGAHLHIQDLGSTNGTFVNGARVRDRPTSLSHGAHLQLGDIELRAQRQTADELERLQQVYGSTTRDGELGVSNSPYFAERLEAELAYAVRHRVPISVALVELDPRAKGGRDDPEGMELLGAFLAPTVRAEDLVALTGNRRFAVLLRGTTASGATIVMERIRHEMESGIGGGRTVSIGVATRDVTRPFHTGQELLAAAGACVARAVTAGRNLVVSD